MDNSMLNSDSKKLQIVVAAALLLRMMFQGLATVVVQRVC